MALNIKNQRVCDLAREAARVSGKTQVSVLEEALERYLSEHEAANQERIAMRRARIDAVLARVDALMTDEHRETMLRTMDELYDDMGLPQ